MLIEPLAGGHHGQYASWMAKGLTEKGAQVTLVTLPQFLNVAPFATMLKGSDGSCENGMINIMPLKQKVERHYDWCNSSVIGSQISYWRMFKIWCRELNPSIVPEIIFLPYLDYCFYAIGILGSPFGKIPWSGIFMRPTFHYREFGIIAPKSSFGFIKRYLFFKVLKNQYLHRILTIDESFSEYVSATKSTDNKVQFLIEPEEFDILYDSNIAKLRIGRKPERKLLLVFGTITQRKGISELISALNDHAWPSEVDVFLAGQLSADVENIFNNSGIANLISSGRLVIANRFFEAFEVSSLFSAADIVWLGYKNHYVPSGVLVQACQAKVPVIACNDGYIGWQTQRLKCGEIVDIRDKKSIIAAVKTICRKSRNSYEANRGKNFENISKINVDNLLSSLS